VQVLLDLLLEESIASILRVERISELLATFANVPNLLILFTLKMKAIHSSEMLIQSKPTCRHIPEDGIMLSTMVTILTTVTIL
jgi:hypothetical protein